MRLYQYDFVVCGYFYTQTVHDCENKEDAIEKIKENMGCRRCDIEWIGNRKRTR